MAFLDALADHIASLGQPSGEVWFRGQSDARWPLTPSLLRAKMPAEQEKNMLAQFRYRAMGIVADHPGDADAPRWQFLMQHYGLPTRLLDWSESALAALFFAVAANADCDGRLFFLVPMLLNEQQIGERLLIAPTMAPCSDILWASFKGTEKPSKIVAISTYASNDRLVRQRGGFTVHGTASDLQTIAPSAALSSMLVPSAIKRTLRETLAHLGVTRTTLFHDVDSLAIELREQYGLS